MTDQLTDDRGYRCCDPSCAENSSDPMAGLCGACEDHYAAIRADDEDEEA